jgi:hypothetical protein
MVNVRGAVVVKAATADNRHMSEHDDPRPVAPEAPLPGDCCDSGCDRCVYDLHNEEVARYRQQLAAWCARHPDQAS